MFTVYWTGLIYNSGQGVVTDVNKAREFFLKAADQGNQFAKKELGTLHVML